MSEKSAKKMTTSVSSGLAKATVAAAGLAAMFTGISKILDEMGHKKTSNVF
jgi:hypothetical protein